MDDTSRRVGNPQSMTGRGDEDVLGRSTEDERSEDVSRRSTEIRHEIEQTREELSETVEAIQERLRPRNIVAGAARRVKTATTERVREMSQNAGDAAEDAASYTRDRIERTYDTVRTNPIPVAMIGIGAAWLLMQRSNRRDRFRDDYASSDYLRFNQGDRYRTRLFREETGDQGESLTAGATESAEYLRDRATDYVGQSRVAVRRAQTQLQRMMEENPLLVGAGALMLGAAFGAVVPETERENELMGGARDTVVDRAQSLARDAATNVQNAAGSAVVDAATKTLTGEQS